MFNNNYPNGGAYGYGYGAPRPQARNTQPLTNEQIAALQQSGDAFSMKVDQTDLWRAACTHKRKDNGASTLVQNADGSYTCTICHETFHLVDLNKDEVEETINKVIDMFQTLKTVYLDAPDDLIIQYMKQIPLLKKFVQLWDRGMRNFSMYEGAMNPLNPINPGMSGFAAMQNLLSNPYGYGFMGQPAYGYNPAMGQQPVMQQQPVMGQQPAYGYGYNPMMAQQPVMQQPGYMPQDPNPMAYGAPVAPMPGVMPAAQAPAAPAAPATANGNTVETTTVMSI